MPTEHELLRRAIKIGEEMVRISDAAGQSLASVHLHTGLEMLRAHVERIEAALNNSEDTP